MTNCFCLISAIKWCVICSHQNLPVAERNVKVFLYLMVFTKKQIAEDASIELKLKELLNLFS